jgi:peptidoglycan LD-endopeptidase LytH
MNRTQTSVLLGILLMISLASCTTSGPSGIFGKKTPHEVYGDKLKEAGLGETALARQWFEAAQKSVLQPSMVKLPYSEAGYFAAEQPRAVGLKFTAKRGEKLTINLTKKPTTGLALFIDLYQSPVSNEVPKLITSADDTTAASLQYDVRQDGMYLVRIQPELLKSGEYTIAITNGPSLAFPVSPGSKSNVGSFWGADRDRGARRHEGIDIFAAKRTPIVAAADGTITSVSENGLGGKVIFLRPSNKDFTLYYAHLDEQLVQQGQQVKAGEVIGLVGNTGNAKTTASHLHFGIYTNGGAIDPFPFVNRTQKQVEKITAPLQQLAKMVRAEKAAVIYTNVDATGTAVKVEANTLLRVYAATENKYKVALPDGNEGFIASINVASLTKPVKKISVPVAAPILDQPSVTGIKKATINPGENVSVLATFKDYYYVSDKDGEGWLSKSML